MNSGLLTVICLCLAAPMATGLACISCTGSSLNGAADTCVDAASSLTSTPCPEATSGLETRCKFTSTEGSALGITTKTADRRCEDVAPSTENKCTTTDVDAGVVSTKRTVCYCNDKDNCNGQTTLAPAMMTSLVGMAMAIYSVL